MIVDQRAFTFRMPLRLLPNAKSNLRSVSEVCDLAVQVSKKGDVFVKVSNVSCTRRAAFSKNQWDAKSDALSLIRFQSSRNRRLFICDCEPFLLPLDRESQFTKLRLGIGHLCQLTNGNIKLMYVPRFVKQKQVPKSIPGKQSHRLFT